MAIITVVIITMAIITVAIITIAIIIIITIAIMIAFLGKDAIVSKAPKGNGIGATGSKNPLAYRNPCFSLLGMVLRTWVCF